MENIDKTDIYEIQERAVNISNSLLALSILINVEASAVSGITVDTLSAISGLTEAVLVLAKKHSDDCCELI